MPSSNPYPELPNPQAGVDPLAPIEHAIGWLVQAGLQLLLGLAIGAVAARLLRAANLRWSWAAAGLSLAVVARQPLGGSFPLIAAALLVATVRGRRWQREQLEAGGDLAAAAAARSGPLDLLRRLARRAALRRRLARSAGGWLRDGSLIVGRDGDGRTVAIPFGTSGGGRHTLVLGATGSGKTVTQAWIALRAIEHGMGAVVIDPKGDHQLRAQALAAARVAGRRFVEWTPQGPCVYNPYAHGADTEIADKALSGERFSEPHYQRQAQRYLGHVVRALRAGGQEVSLRAIVEQLDPARLELLARRLPEQAAQATHAYLDSLSARQRSDLSGVRDRLAILAESDVGRWLDPHAARAASFDLHEALGERAVVYFDLDADSRPLLTQMLGAAIVADLQAAMAARQGRPLPTLVVIDEFAALAAEQVVRLFGRGRSAGLNLVLATQELADLRPPGGGRLLEQVMGNLSALIAHRQVVPDSAATIAHIAGTTGAWRTARHSGGRTTRTRTREGVLDSSELTRLSTGWAVVLTLSRGGQVRLAHMFSPQEQVR